MLLCCCQLWSTVPLLLFACAYVPLKPLGHNPDRDLGNKVVIHLKLTDLVFWILIRLGSKFVVTSVVSVLQKYNTSNQLTDKIRHPPKNVFIVTIPFLKITLFLKNYKGEI